MDLKVYQVCSNGVPGVQNGGEGLVFGNKIYFKIFFRTAWLRGLKFGMQHWLVFCYQIYSNGGPGVQNSPAPEGPGFEHRNT